WATSGELRYHTSTIHKGIGFSQMPKNWRKRIRSVQRQIRRAPIVRDGRQLSMAELIQSELDISGRLGRKRQGLGLALSAILSAGDRHRRARKDFSKTDLAGPTCVCLSICVTRAVGHKYACRSCYYPPPCRRQ